MSVIPVAGVERTASHPAWTPVSVDGSVVTGAAVGDPQAFGIGTADKDVGGNTFKGDSGQMITISGYNFAKTNEDHSGDGDDAQQMRGVGFQVPGSRQLSFVVPASWEWMAKFFQTVANDAAERPMTIVDTYATGASVSQQFLIDNMSHPIEAKGVLKMEVDLTPYGAGTETGLA